MSEKTFNSFSGLLTAFKAVHRNLPAMKNGMLRTYGEEVVFDASENLIGRTTGGSFPYWPALKPNTVFRKSLKGEGKGGNPESMLYATGRLAQSIKYKILQKGVEVVIYTNVPYAADHEYGSIARNIPARPFLAPAAIRVMGRARKNFELILKATLEGDKPFARIR